MGGRWIPGLSTWMWRFLILVTPVVSGSLFLVPLGNRNASGVSYHVTLLSERSSMARIQRPLSATQETFNIAYTHPVHLTLPIEAATRVVNATVNRRAMQVQSDANIVAFMTSQGPADVTMTSLIPIANDNFEFIIPYFVHPSDTDASLIITGASSIWFYFKDQTGRLVKEYRKSGSKDQTFRIVPGRDVTGYRITSRRMVSLYVDMPCLVTPAKPGYCGTAHVPVPPVMRLGYDYVIPRSPGRYNDVKYRVVAALGATHVLVWDRSSEWRSVASLSVGDYYDGVSDASSEGIALRCDRPCIVTQVLASNTSYNFKALEVVPDLTKSQIVVVFELDTVPQGDVHYLTVLTLTSERSSVLLDGVPLGGARWTSLESWPEWSIATFPTPEGVHMITSVSREVPILVWHYVVLNNELLTFGSITGFSCQDNLCVDFSQDGTCTQCRPGLILNAGKCTGPEVVVHEGSNVTLSCDGPISSMTSSATTTRAVSWYKGENKNVCGSGGQDARKLVAQYESATGTKSVTAIFGTRGRLATPSGNFEITDAQIRDASKYTCIYSRNLLIRMEITLSVVVFPTNISSSWRVIPDGSAHLITITCHVPRVRPRPDEMYWLVGTEQRGTASFSDNSDGTMEARLAHTVEATPSVYDTKCVIVVRNTTVTHPLTVDSGLKLLIKTLNDKSEISSTTPFDKTMNGAKEGRNTKSNDEDSSAINGALIGGIVGGVAALIIIALILVIVICYCRGYNIGLTRAIEKSSHPSADSVIYGIGNMTMTTTCSADGGGQVPGSPTTSTPTCSHSCTPNPAMNVATPKRELLVAIENEYDNCAV